MQELCEYQIYIGCHDSEQLVQLTNEADLRRMVTQFFKKYEIGFSMFNAVGGYLHKDGTFVFEKTLCISLIGNLEQEIIKLARSLSMYMNQECSLVVKDIVKTEYR